MALVKVVVLKAQSFRRLDQALLDSRLRRSCARFLQSARIAFYQLSWREVSSSPSPSSSRSSSNGSLNCSGSQYGPPSGNGLGGCRFGGLATSRSISQPLADSTFYRPCGALGVINSNPDTVGITEIEFGEINSARIAATRHPRMRTIWSPISAAARVVRFMRPTITHWQCGTPR